MLNRTGFASFLVLSSAVSAQGFAFLDETNSRLPLPHIENDGVRADAGDVDGDGDLDILVANGVHSAPVVPLGDFVLQINDGTGRFVNEASSRLPPSAFGTNVGAAVLLLDVDGDGDLDAFVANGASQFDLHPSTFPGFQNRVWINTGSGVFVDETSLRLPARLDVSFHAAYGDVDADGDLDILVGNVGWGGGGEPDRLLINNGVGVFAEGPLPSPSATTEAVSLADLDGDGDLDIVSTPFNLASTPWSEGTRVLINNGAGTFQDETTARLPTFGSVVGEGMLTRDIDGDGDLDIVTAHHGSQTAGGVRVFNNDGAGFFLTSQQVSSGKAHGITAADVDNDGDVDLFASLTDEQESEPALKMLLNVGGGAFQNVSAVTLPPILGTQVRYPMFVDVDGDGDPDVYLPAMCVNKHDRLLINSPVLPVTIDIKPGSPVNTVNLGSHGVTSVAILSNATFDATQVDPLTVRLADAAVRVRGNGTPQTTIQDVNGDSILDLVLHMETEGFQLTAEDVSAGLIGTTFGGQAISGTDLVRVVP